MSLLLIIILAIIIIGTAIGLYKFSKGVDEVIDTMKDNKNKF